MMIFSNITISEVLELESRHYNFFRKIFERVCDVCSRSVMESYVGRFAYDKILKLEEIRNISQLATDCLAILLENDLTDHKLRDYLIYFHALNTIEASYKFCYQADTKNRNSINKMIFGDNEYDYLIDVLDSLSILEDITSRHLTEEVTLHFINKAIEKTIKQEREPQSKGGKIRAGKYKEQKNIIFEGWEKGSFHSYAECAKHFANQFNLANKTIETWLSQKYSQAKKKI